MAELGVYEGEFSREILTTKPAIMYLVDIWQDAASSADKDGTNNTQNWDMFKTYMNLVDQFASNPKVKVIRGRSADFLTRMPDNSLDLVYIDSDHSYETTKEELRLSIPKVKAGGWISGHDYVYLAPGVIQAVDEFLKQTGYKFEYITEDGCPSWFIINNK
jgi:hypothetical protein